MKYLTLGFVLMMVLASCAPNNVDLGNRTDVFTKVYTTENLKTQTFTIDNSHGGIIQGEGGTKIRIKKNTFVNQKGELVKGDITIELKEALTSFDIVQANLTTTYNGQALESGGMIHVNASQNGDPLVMATKKFLQVAIPNDSLLMNMSFFKGFEDSSGVKWIDPEPILEGLEPEAMIMDSFRKSTNVKYNVEGFDDPSDAPARVHMEVSRIGWEGEGLKILKDSSFQIDEFTVNFIKQDELQFFTEFSSTQPGTNTFQTDYKTNYVFEMKNLGWANIDRLLSDPRTTEVKLITEIINNEEFNLVYVTMVTQNMYLPGYQRIDKTYSFSHGDFETQRLPVGETATIMATAYKKNTPYFAIKTITIEKNQKITMDLEETTMDQLKAKLEQEL